MTKQICKIGASNWFSYKEICYDARSHARKKKLSYVFVECCLWDWLHFVVICLAQKQNYFYNYAAVLLLNEEESNINSDTT